MHELITMTYDSDDEASHRKSFEALFDSSPMPTREKLRNLGVYMNRRNLMKVLLINDLYTQILDVHGVIMEFGARWGQNLALFENLRGIYEPYNYNRRIIGFDTFSGFPSVHSKDGSSDIIRPGAYNTTENYEEYLGKVLEYHETESPISHIRKFELVKGDASVTIDEYLGRHPETMIALAYFDFDLYEPTEKCMRAIRDRLPKGSIVVFDELNHPDFPGETLALREVFGMDRYRIRRSRYSGYQSYVVID